MSKLTKEFVEGFLERYDGDLSGPILDLAGGANPTGALLEGLSREEILDWLQEEFDGLLMHGFEPLLEDAGCERNNAEILLGYLEKTKAEKSPGLQFEVEPVGDPEEGYTPEKYIQAYEVSIRYEGTELGTCALECEGAHISGKWVAESAQWPTLLQGLVPLPTVVIQEAQHQRQEVDRIKERETKAEPREISGLSHSDVAASIYGADKVGGTSLPGRSEPAITVTIRQKLVTTAPSAGLLDVIKAYDDIVDRPEVPRFKCLGKHGALAQHRATPRSCKLRVLKG
jgi:hypothetical protein